MSQKLDDLIGGDSPSPNEFVPDEADTPTSVNSVVDEVMDASTVVEGKTLEVAGVITDDQGNTWQVPGGNVEDLDDLYSGNIYKLPTKLTDKFHVQLIPITRLREYVARKFVPVKLTEVGVPLELQQTTGQPLDTYHTVGDSILVKIPREIFDRINARKVKEVKERLAQMEPTEEMIQRTKNTGVVTRVERQQSVDYYKDPSKRPGLGLEDGGK